MDSDKLNDKPLGQFVPTSEGERAFVPAPLPSQLNLSSPLVYVLDQASRSVATLAGIGETLPNPHLLIRPFVHREAVLSSRIEGTQASLSDLFLYEAAQPKNSADAREVANYVVALDQGLEMLAELPICIRLANHLHATLLDGVRGEYRSVGELRDEQNWIGAPGTPIQRARYVPPPASALPQLTSDWERFANADVEMPPLVRCALLHYQFEAIHPYIDGNGRVGRLLIMLFLHSEDVLPKPLLYLSAYFEKNRAAYYDHLLRVSTSGDWEPWLRFFLDGVAEQANDAIARSRRIRELHERYREELQARGESGNVLRLLDELFLSPVMTSPMAYRRLGLSREGTRRLLERLVDADIIELLPETWPKLFVARELLDVIDLPID